MENELKEEGYLRPDEVLLDVLKSNSNLYRTPTADECFDDIDIGNFPDDWTEEDFEYYRQHG